MAVLIIFLEKDTIQANMVILKRKKQLFDDKRTLQTIGQGSCKMRYNLDLKIREGSKLSTN